MGSKTTKYGKEIYKIWEGNLQNMGSKSYKIQIIGGRRSCPVLVIACNVDSLPSVSVMGWPKIRKYNTNTNTIKMGWPKIQHKYK